MKLGQNWRFKWFVGRLYHDYIIEALSRFLMTILSSTEAFAADTRKTPDLA